MKPRRFRTDRSIATWALMLALVVSAPVSRVGADATTLTVRLLRSNGASAGTAELTASTRARIDTIAKLTP